MKTVIAQAPTSTQPSNQSLRGHLSDPSLWIGLVSGIMVILVGQWIGHLFTKKRDSDKESKDVWRQKMDNEKTSQVLEFQATLNKIANNMVTQEQFAGLETKVGNLETTMTTGFKRIDRRFEQVDRKFDVLTRGMPENKEMKRLDEEYRAANWPDQDT